MDEALIPKVEVSSSTECDQDDANTHKMISSSSSVASPTQDDEKVLPSPTTTAKVTSTAVAARPVHRLRREANEVAARSQSMWLQRLTPMERRIVMGAGRTVLSIGEGLLVRNRIISPVISAGLIAYGTFRLIQDYRHGAPNLLGYRTTGRDIALSVGKELATAAVGIAIGTAVGALIGISTIPVAGQIVLGAVLSAGLGICVGALLTRYIDRLVIRISIRRQYKYPKNEKGARRRFEELLAERQDLSTFEVCRLVQHYADYRVASGWESPNDIDDYRESSDIRLMPVSFQHYAIVQLQRKWGFLNDRAACRKVFKALMLTHHPDRGGTADMAAQLNNDFEVYAFCQGWEEDCPTLLSAADAPPPDPDAPRNRRRRRHVVVDFLRSLFRPATNSVVEAEDLHQFGLLTLESGTARQMHRLDVLANDTELDDELSFTQFDEDEDGVGNSAHTRGKAMQQSVARVLAAVQFRYQEAAEAITFSALVRVHQDAAQWQRVRNAVFLFNRLQCALMASQADVDAFPDAATASSVSPTGDEFAASNTAHRSGAFTWRTTAEAVAKREALRHELVETIFVEETAKALEVVYELWCTAKELAEGFLKQEYTGDKTEDQASAQVLDTLLNLQRKIEAATESARAPWREEVEDWAEEESGGAALSTVDDVRDVGLTASWALAGEHAATKLPTVKDRCDAYFRQRPRKRENTVDLLTELRELESDRAAASLNNISATPSSVAATVGEELDTRINNFMVKLSLLEQEQARADFDMSELHDMCVLHLPERAAELTAYPSSCVLAVDGEYHVPRRIAFERERTLMSYSKMELEDPSPIDPARTAQPQSQDGVTLTLYKALHTDPLTGNVTYCWLKRYTLPRLPGDDNDDGALTRNVDAIEEVVDEVAVAKAKQERLRLVQRILDKELFSASRCSSSSVVAPTAAFSDYDGEHLFVHVPRGSTQLRFSSVHEVKRRIEMLGVKWLCDALQALLDLHACRVSHGSLSLCSFTFDDFGNTALGFFSRCTTRPSPTSPGETPDTIWENRRKKDVTDFGIMLVAEVVPFMFGGAAAVSQTSPTTTSSPGKLSPSPQQQHLQMLEARQVDVAMVFQEVGDRLIRRKRPEWSLADARAFVRRFAEMDADPDDDERTYTFSKEVTFPPSWVLPSHSLTPVIVRREYRLSLPTALGTTRVLLNLHMPLWKNYWKARRAAVLSRLGGKHDAPPFLTVVRPVVPCTDDCEVNERFVWFPCADEEAAWEASHQGFSKKGSTHTRFFAAPAPPAPGSGSCWGLLVRAALGTVVEVTNEPMSAETLGSRSAITAPLQSPPFGWTLDVPSLRAYPEYIVEMVPSAVGTAQEAKAE